MRKQIAIFGWKVGDNSYGITTSYYDYFDSFGDVNILSPIKEIDFTKYDLLVVPGGPDVNPATYGYIPNMSTQKSDPIKEYFDKYMLPNAIDSGIGICGICRGHQSIAVHFGMPINQRMWHETNSSNDRSKLVHDIDIFTAELPEKLGKALTEKIRTVRKDKKTVSGFRSQKVNSMHHQTVAEVPGDARLIATHYHKDHKEDHSIEALYYPEHNIFTFQYHPEEIWDKFSRICVTYLLKSTEKHDEKSEIEEVLKGST